MTGENAFTRREFLNASLVVVSTVATVPTFLHHQALAMADGLSPALSSHPGVPEDRILLVVQLSGGNDGLNTIVPYGMDEYYTARPQIAVAKNQVLKVNDNPVVGLHPELADLKEMIDGARAAVIQGVGYPNPNRSHFASMDIWHTADTRGGKGLGWLGKALDQKTGDPAHAASDATACVCIGHDPVLAAQGQIVKPIEFENTTLFRWSPGANDPALESAYDRFNRAGPLAATSAAARGAAAAQADTAARAGAAARAGTANALREIPRDDSQAAFVLRTAFDAQIASDQVRAAAARGTVTNFPNGQLAGQLRMVASMIRAGLPTRVYYVALGGFDTHAAQPGRQPALLRQFGSAMKAFYNELKAQGQEKRVVAVAFSEFGRRVAQNASNGTDHGTAGPMFLFGDSATIRPGLLGDHPSLLKSKLDQGDLMYQVDFRCVYASILEHWLKVDSAKVLGQAFTPANILAPALSA